jgi:Reverse transcriptase (RNA-dependent DNA polymerase)
MSLVCLLGTYGFKVMPFGFKKALSIFQRAVNAILHQFNSLNVICFLDQIIIGSRNFIDDLNTHWCLVEKIHTNRNLRNKR